MPGDPNSIGYTVFVSSRSGSLKDVLWELEQAEKMKWIMLCGVGGVDDLCLRTGFACLFGRDKFDLLF